MNAIDTNIVAYTFDPTAPTKQARARQLLYDLVLNSHETVLLWQVPFRRRPTFRPGVKAAHLFPCKVFAQDGGIDDQRSWYKRTFYGSRYLSAK